MEYLIHEDNMERFEKKMVTLRNKSNMYGCQFTYEVLGEEFKEVEDDRGYKRMARFVKVNVEGEAKVNGWEFVGKIEHTENGNIFHCAGKTEIPERYRHVECKCEHCGTVRRRNDSFIIFNEESAEFKQIGKNCLGDYTHGMSADLIGRFWSSFNSFAEFEAPHGDGTKYYINTMDMLASMLISIDKYGYVKKYADDGGYNYNNTVNEAELIVLYTEGMLEMLKEKDYVEKRYGHVGKEELESRYDDAKKVVEFVMNVEKDGNYWGNLKVALKNEMNSWSDAALIASAIPAMRKMVEAKKEFEAKQNAEKQSEYVGNVGDRIKGVKIVSADCVTSWETQYGTTYVWKFIGTDGNVYTTKTSNWWSDLEKMNATIDGTIKAHTEFRGVKQTELQRVKMVAHAEETHKAGTFDESVIDKFCEDLK